jgi:hypothetical protein
VVSVGIRHDPLMEAAPPVAERVVKSFVRSGNEAVEGHGHVENGFRHRDSFPARGTGCAQALRSAFIGHVRSVAPVSLTRRMAALRLAATT